MVKRNFEQELVVLIIASTTLMTQMVVNYIYPENPLAKGEMYFFLMLWGVLIGSSFCMKFLNKPSSA